MWQVFDQTKTHKGPTFPLLLHLVGNHSVALVNCDTVAADLYIIFFPAEEPPKARN
jgi:hypothetical protein